MTHPDIKLSKQIHIRQFVFPDDYQAVFHLWQSATPGIQLGPSDTIEEIGKKVARDPDLFLVAERHNQIIGSVLGGFDGRRGLIYHLVVDSAWRGNKLGGMLMEAVEEKLIEKGCIRYYLLVTQDNTNAQQFYEHLGCKKMDLYTYGKYIE